MFMFLDSKRHRHYSFIKTCVQQCEVSRPSVNDTCSSLSVLRVWNENKCSCNVVSVDSSAAHRVALCKESRQLAATD